MHRIVAAATVANEWLVRHRYGLPTAFFGIGLISIVIGITASQYAGAQLLRAEVGKDAARWAAFLGSSLDRLGIIVETGMIAPEESRTLNRIAKAGGLTSYRIIGPDGRVMIASSPETIGQKIFADGFGPSIRGGGALASIERADTADGGTAVIGRATVPIMSGKTFLGAIEVSIDRTARAADHVRMTTGLTLFLGLLIAAIALVATAYVQQRDSRRQAGQSGLEQLRNTLEQQRGEFTLQTEQLGGRHQGAAAPRQTQPAQNQPAPNQPPRSSRPRSSRKHGRTRPCRRGFSWSKAIRSAGTRPRPCWTAAATGSLSRSTVWKRSPRSGASDMTRSSWNIACRSWMGSMPLG